MPNKVSGLVVKHLISLISLADSILKFTYPITKSTPKPIPLRHRDSGKHIVLMSDSDSFIRIFIS